MESFNANLQGGKKLVKSLEKQSVRSTQPHNHSAAPAPSGPRFPPPGPAACRLAGCV
jgi:hypothetical protein